MIAHKNRVQMTVSGTPGTGTITLGSASSGYQSLAAAHGANATVDVLITDGTAWEVARSCTYTHSGTTLSRGTLEASSTGSAISLTSSAVVSQIATADRGRQWMAAALDHVSGTDAGTTMALNSLYVVDMSAWATANRTYTLPATAAVGDRIGVMLAAGNASYSLILTAGSGDTLNGVAGGTEWSRLLIAGEVVVMRCTAASATWIVEFDGRLDTGFSAIANGTNTQNMSTGAGTTAVTGSGGALRTVQKNTAGYWDTTSGVFFPKRAGTYLIGGSAVIDEINDANYIAVYLSHSTDGSTYSDAGEKSGIAWRGVSSAASLVIGGSGSFVVSANGTTDRWLMRVFHSASGTPKLPGSAANRAWARFWARWIGD